MKTICYLRYYNKNQLYSLAKLIRPKYQVKIISEYNPIDETGLNKIYYQNLNLYKKKFFDKKTENEIILRCRLLRNIKKSEAIKHLNAMAFAINKVFKLEKPNLVKLQEVESEMLQNFYKDSKKVDNKKMKTFFKYNLKYPSYEEGLNYIFNNGI